MYHIHTQAHFITKMIFIFTIIHLIFLQVMYSQINGEWAGWQSCGIWARTKFAKPLPTHKTILYHHWWINGQYVVETIIEWNNLDSNLLNSENFDIFKIIFLNLSDPNQTVFLTATILKELYWSHELYWSPRVKSFTWAQIQV